MSYVVLARKWRPMSFEDLVGQEHVARTLAGAIDRGRVAHAFLFTGVRGVGKTTAARILAKALNCTGAPGAAAGPASGPTATPCLQCDACREITAGTDMDVREIDGASYTGVDDVRKLQDSLPYRPSRDRFKIFVVDEVHMLSSNAWNAFLKTLEEPPAHVKFIFATTEAHKVPVTILSRVQRFDFKLIPTQLIAKRLRHVLDAEGIQSDDQAISIVAREAAGSMRDAMSLLDQVIAWGGDRLVGDDVARVLGVASRQVLHDVTRALVGGDAARCLEVVSQLSSQGYDIATVARDLLALLRDLVVAKVCADPDSLLDLADEEKRDVRELAAAADADDLIRIHQGFSRGFDDVVRSGQPRPALEMLLVRLSRRPPLIPLDELVGRLAALERRLGGAPARRGPGGGGAPPSGGVGERPRRPPGSGKGPAGPQQRHQARQARPPGEGPHRLVPSSTPAAPCDPVASPELKTWRAIVERVSSERPEVAAFLQHAVLRGIDGDRLVLGFERGSVFEKEATREESVETLRRAAGEELGSTPVIAFEEVSGEQMRDTTVASIRSRERELRQKEAREKVQQHPSIAQVSEVLGARLKEVRLADE